MKLKKDTKRHIQRFGDYETTNAFKMMGNDYRMNILLVLRDHPGLTLDQINQQVGGDIKNIHSHTKKLFNAGLIHKRYQGNAVQHTLSGYGKVALKAFSLFIEYDPT